MPTYEPLHQYRYLSWQGGTKFYWAAASDHLHQSSDKGEYIATDSCFTLTQLHSVVYWWLTLDDWLLLYASQVKHLWFQQKQKREATVIATVALSWDQMLAVKTGEAKWLKDNHWMLRQTHWLHQYRCLGWQEARSSIEQQPCSDLLPPTLQSRWLLRRNSA